MAREQRQDAGWRAAWGAAGLQGVPVPPWGGESAGSLSRVRLWAAQPPRPLRVGGRSSSTKLGPSKALVSMLLERGAEAGVPPTLGSVGQAPPRGGGQTISPPALEASLPRSSWKVLEAATVLLAYVTSLPVHKGWSTHVLLPPTRTWTQTCPSRTHGPTQHLPPPDLLPLAAVSPALTVAGSGQRPAGPLVSWPLTR